MAFRTRAIASKTVVITVLALGALVQDAASVSAQSGQPDKIVLLYRQVGQLTHDGKYAEAAALGERVLAEAERRFGPDSPIAAMALGSLGYAYLRDGKLAAAEPVMKRCLALHEKVDGPEHPNVAQALSDLGMLYDEEGRYAEAEPLLQRSVAIRVKQFGDERPEVAQSLNNLAAVYQDEGKLDAALPLFQKSLAIQEKALEPTDPLLAIPLGNLGFVYKTLGKFRLAEPLYVRALSISEKALGAEHPNVTAALNNLAQLYVAEGKLPVAEPLLQRALSIREKTLGPEHTDVAVSLNNLAGLYREEDRFAAAEPLLLRSVAIFEKALGPEHPAVARVLNNLAELYLAQGRLMVAERPLLRSVAIWEKAQGRQHPDYAKALANLAALYQRDGKPAAAEPLHKRSLAIIEAAWGSEHPGVATAINNLAGFYQAQGQFAAAEPLYRRSLAIVEKALGPLHPATALALNNLASLTQAEGRPEEAGPLYERSLAIYKTSLGDGHPNVAVALANLATLSFDRKEWAQAANFWQQSTALIEHRAMPVSPFGEQPSTSGQVRSSVYFRALIKAAYRSAGTSQPAPPDLIRRMFLKAQWSRQSDAAEAMAQMAARGVKGNTKLAGIIRDRQDLLWEWQARTIIQLAAFSKSPEKRNPEAETANSTRLHDIAVHISEIDAKLKTDFIDYADLASPVPVSIEDVQGDLDANEALILFLDTEELAPTPEETFVWVVTKTDVRWFRSKLGTASLNREVTALRCGLDYEGSWGTENSPCPALFQSAYTDDDYQAGSPLPFDLTRSHALYRELLGPAEDLTKGKSLLIVPSGALTKLPFQVLTSEAPEPSATGVDALRSAHWLIRDHALTVLPSASSLKSLRRRTRPSDASRPMIGFGNPLLNGSAEDAARAKTAITNTTCPVKVASQSGLSRGVPPISTEGGPAEIAAQLRGAPPLPETADELCAVARELGAGPSDIYLGSRATTPELTRLNDEGLLTAYRIIHFATHGAVSGQITGKEEPGLIMTPPDMATADDNGYLPVSKIEDLKLDADLVILSACNTAAAKNNEGAEALSGLASAFFYAGARALLVSHWSVDSGVTVKLITGAMTRLATDKTIGRAEAMRQSMLALVEQGAPQEAHPASWAPFVVVGEGGFNAPVHLDKGKPGEMWSTSTIPGKRDAAH